MESSRARQKIAEKAWPLTPSLLTSADNSLKATMAKAFPIRHRNHQLEAASRLFFANCLPTTWTSEQPTNDYGIDLRVDMSDGTQATGLELLVQLKSCVNANQRTYESVRLKVSTYNYLWERLQVVMLVMYVAENNEAYWQMLRNVPDPPQDQTTFTVRISKSNLLSELDWADVRRIVEEVTDNKVAAQRRFVQENPREDGQVQRPPSR